MRAAGLRTIALTDLPPASLQALLDEQAEEWRATLLWDFCRVGQRVRFLAELQALRGRALVDASGRAVGYICYSVENGCVRVDDLYVCRESREIDNNTSLLASVLDEDTDIDCAAIACSVPHALGIHRLPGKAVAFPRVAEAASVSRICAGYQRSASHTVAVRPWHETYFAEAAELIPQAYAGHDESAINWFAASRETAADFLEGIMSVQSDFDFLPSASVAAIHQETGHLCGFLLATHAMEGVAYANILCVAPWAAGHNLGDRLSREFALTLDGLGYRTVTLRRTATDRRLSRFYRRMGFEAQCDLMAYTWARS